jgi:hypothetical protein
LAEAEEFLAAVASFVGGGADCDGLHEMIASIAAAAVTLTKFGMVS